MSDPTRLYICQSATFHTNKRKLDLENEIDRKIRLKLPARVAANFLPPYFWCYASQNQQDGDFSGYTTKEFHRIFTGFGLEVSTRITQKLIVAMRKTGFFDPKMRLHSWKKYNEFFSTAQQRQAARDRWRKQREKERKEAEAKAKAEAEAKAQMNGGGVKKPTPTQELWVIEKQLEFAQGEEKKKLLKRKRELLRETTGVEKDSPADPATAAGRRGTANVERTSAERRREFLGMARQTLKDLPDSLTEKMVTALYEEGDHLPSVVTKKFAKLLEQLGEKSPRNPVPG